jgi:hypothetical protein
MAKIAVVMLLIVLFTLGCGPKQGSNVPAAPAPEKKETLQEKVDRLESELIDLQVTIMRMSGDGWTEVNTANKGYDAIQTKFGTFLVSCNNITPYLDGYKVHVGIGNLTTANFNGATISFSWKKHKHQKEVSFTNVFSPGVWTTVELEMTPAQPEDIKSFFMSFKFNQIGLRK